MSRILALGLAAGLLACSSDSTPEEPLPRLVYANGASTLYSLDVASLAATPVGPLTGCEAAEAVDIAIDQQGGLWVSNGALNKVDPATGTCTKVGGSTVPVALAFVPAGILDPAQETLVGYYGNEYVKINMADGTTSDVGPLATGNDPNAQLSISGDLVYTYDGRLFLSVSGPGCGDCIVEADPNSGALKKNYGPVPYKNVYGLAAWRGTLYGFTESGEVFSATLDGDAWKTADIPQAPGATLQFGGAAMLF